MHYSWICRMSLRATDDAYSSYYYNTIMKSKSLVYWGYSWLFVSCNGLLRLKNCDFTGFIPQFWYFHVFSSFSSEPYHDCALLVQLSVVLWAHSWLITLGDAWPTPVPWFDRHACRVYAPYIVPLANHVTCSQCVSRVDVDVLIAHAPKSAADLAAW